MTHGHEQWCGDGLSEWVGLGGSGQWRKIETSVITQSIKYNFKKVLRDLSGVLQLALPQTNQLCIHTENTLLELYYISEFLARLL